jgi:hypothetical protein
MFGDTSVGDTLPHYPQVSPGLNPILHTAWLENHALTLKSNIAKYYFGEKSIFCIPS